MWISGHIFSGGLTWKFQLKTGEIRHRVKFCVSNFVSVPQVFSQERNWNNITRNLYKNSRLTVGNFTKFVLFGQFNHSRLEVLQIPQLLDLVNLVSVSLMRVNLRGLRENFKHKIRTILLFPRSHRYPHIQLLDQIIFLQKGYAFVRASGQSEKWEIVLQPILQ